MDKPELLKIALEQLIEQFKVTPESFYYNATFSNTFNSSGTFHNTEAVVWEPKIDVNGSIIDDPNQYKNIVITFTPGLNEMGCLIFHKDKITGSKYDAAQAEMSTKYSRRFERCRSNYKKFKYLCNLITTRDKRHEYRQFLTKLYSIFPGTMDKHLFDK
jgi:hypothetical protein